MQQQQLNSILKHTELQNPIQFHNNNNSQLENINNSQSKKRQNQIHIKKSQRFFTKNQFNQTNISKSQQLIKKIIMLNDKQGIRLIKKYNINYLITLLDKSKIQAIDRVYRVRQQGFNLLQFIRFFLNAIQHSQTQTLYLTIGLVDFFKTISQINSFTQRVKFIHLTDFICNNILSNELNNNTNTSNDNKIQMKLIPAHKMIKPQFEIKQYITNPPTIYGNKQQIIYKLSLNNAKIDKNKHDSVVTNCQFSKTYHKIFSLDALADAICIYDTNCKLLKRLKPSTSKVKKDVVVLSFAYSQRQQRIGAVLKDFTLTFWDFTDNFQFQKIISTASACVQYQTNIWYLDYFQSWITSDRSGTISIWNIEKQIPQRKIQCKFRGKINDVAQIPCLNIIAVAQEGRINRLNPGKKQGEESKIILYNFFNGEQLADISSQIDMRIPHTLQYSESYQVLLSAGFQKKINIFQINHKYLDTNLKGQLLGHESLITNFILIKKTPMVVSSDDKGKVKIWDIRNYNCIQTLDFRDKTIITRLLDMVEIGKLGVLGSRVNFLQYDQKAQIAKKYETKYKNLPVQLSFIYEKNKLLVVTKKDIRLYNMQTGSIQKIYCDYHNKDEEIVVFKYYQLMKKIVIGNQKGQIKLYNLLSPTKNDPSNLNINQEKLQGFQNGLVTHIQYDQDNKLFLACGQNGTINIERLVQNNTTVSDISNQYQQQNQQHNQIKQRTHTQKKWAVIRQMKGNFNNKDIHTLAFSVYHSLIAVGSTFSDIYVWDYEYAQILFHIVLPNGIEPSAMTFLNGYSILIIAAGNGQLFFVKLERNTDQSNIMKKLQPKVLLYYNTNNDKYKQQDSNKEYISDILTDIALQGSQQKKRQKIQSGKLFLPLSSGRVIILDISEFLLKLTLEPHRKTFMTYNPERQLKQQFSVQLQKDKCIKHEITQKQIQSFKNFICPVKTFIAHNGIINSMKIIEFDRHYLVTCGGNDERIKLWQDNKLIGDSNINLPLPYKWSFSIEEQKKNKDKIMFSLKIIQSIFKKFGSDISTGESKVLKLQNFFKHLQTNNPPNFITQPQQQQQKKETYLFQKQFTPKDLHYEQIKKYNFHEVGGPSLRELDFKKKLQNMQKQWQISKQKQQEQKNQLLIKIQYRAQKNQQKEQVMNFLQQRGLMKKKNKKYQQQQLPYVKRVVDQLKKIEPPVVNNCLLLNNSSGSFFSVMANNSNAEYNNLITNKYICYQNKQNKQNNTILLRNNMISSLKSKKRQLRKFQQYYKQKSTNGIVLNNVSSNSSFIDNYQNINKIQSNVVSGLSSPDYFSLNNSRINSTTKRIIQTSKGIRQNSKAMGQTRQTIKRAIQTSDNKGIRQKSRDVSFQNIIKDMNKKILLSKQSRTSLNNSNLVEQGDKIVNLLRSQQTSKKLKTHLNWFKKAQ